MRLGENLWCQFTRIFTNSNISNWFSKCSTMNKTSVEISITKSQFVGFKSYMYIELRSRRSQISGNLTSDLSGFFSFFWKLFTWFTYLCLLRHNKFEPQHKDLVVHRLNFRRTVGTCMVVQHWCWMYNTAGVGRVQWTLEKLGDRKVWGWNCVDIPWIQFDIRHRSQQI